MNTNFVADEKASRARIWRMKVEFTPGTDFNRAVSEMWRLHYETKSDIETVFNGLRVIIADNEMFEKFGYRGMKP